MSKKLHVSTSPLSNTIFAGTILKDGRTWSASKQDVTMDALVGEIRNEPTCFMDWICNAWSFTNSRSTTLCNRDNPELTGAACRVQRNEVKRGSARC